MKSFIILLAFITLAPAAFTAVPKDKIVVGVGNSGKCVEVRAPKTTVTAGTPPVINRADLKKVEVRVVPCPPVTGTVPNPRKP